MDPSSAAPLCMHEDPDSPYRKPFSRLNSGSAEDGGKDDDASKAKEISDPEVCEQCYVYGCRASYARRTPSKPTYDSQNERPRPHISPTAFEEGSKTSNDRFRNLTLNKDLVKLVHRPSPPQKARFTVKLEGDQFGEAYHALICQLLLDRTYKQDRDDFQLKIDYIDTRKSHKKTVGIEGFKALFGWYPIHAQSYSLNCNSVGTSKATSTQFIAAAFRTPEDTKRKNAFVFALIRNSLGMRVDAESDSMTGQQHELGPQRKTEEQNKNYLKPAYAAKYWLNRYFRLTKQFRCLDLTKQTTELISKDREPSYTGLPKLNQVNLVAVIHIRRTPESGSKVGRVMDDDNLTRVLDSIRQVNKLRSQRLRDERDDGSCYRYFTHVILYGDFSYAEGVKMKETINLSAVEKFDKATRANARRIASRKSNLGARSYSQFPDSATAPDWKDKLAAAKKEIETKKKFEDNQTMRDPPEFHVSFICRPWETFANDAEKSTEEKRKAYAHLDPEEQQEHQEEEKKVHDLWKNFRDSEVDQLPLQVKVLGIWTALSERYGNQICVIGHRSGFVEAAGLIGIPIFYLMDSDLSSEQKSKTLFDAREYPPPEINRLLELADVMNTFIPIDVFSDEDKVKISKNEEVFRIPGVQSNDGRRLKAALFMYMCCRLEPEGLPAWTARVEKMHDEQGRKWLRQKYLLGIEKS